MAGQQHPPGPGLCGPQPAEHALAAAVGQHLNGKHVLADPSRGQHDPLGLQHRSHRATAIAGQLVAQGCFQHRDVELFLAEQGQLPAMLQAQEVRQPPRPDAFGAGGSSTRYTRLNRAGSSRSMAPARASHRAP
jgi:hypothetical protein